MLGGVFPLGDKSAMHESRQTESSALEIIVGRHGGLRAVFSPPPASPCRLRARPVPGNSPQTTVELAKSNNRKSHGNVISAEYQLHFADCNNRPEVETEFARIGLAPRVEIASGEFAFWKPDDAEYAAKSRPAKY